MNFNRQQVEEVTVYDITDGDRPLSAHFRLSEFRCKTRNPKNYIILVHSQLIQLLEGIRRRANEIYGGGVSVTINSAYRTEHYNKIIVKGASHSQHTKGMAADIVLKRADGTIIPQTQVKAIAEEFNPGGIGLYNDFVHVDVFGLNRRW